MALPVAARHIVRRRRGLSPAARLSLIRRPPTSLQPPAIVRFFSFLFFVPFATRRCEPSACCGPRRRAGAAAGAPRTTDQSPAPSPAAGRCPSPARAPWLTALPPPPATAQQRQNRCASERLATPLEGEGVSEGARRMLRRGEDERRRSARQPAPPSRAPASGALRMAPDPVPLCPSTPSVCLPAPHPARSARPPGPPGPASPTTTTTTRCLDDRRHLVVAPRLRDLQSGLAGVGLCMARAAGSGQCVRGGAGDCGVGFWAQRRSRGEFAPLPTPRYDRTDEAEPAVASAQNRVPAPKMGVPRTNRRF